MWSNWGGKLSYKDISVPTGVDSYTVKATDISSSAKIVAAGAMSRPHDGWGEFNVTYNETYAKITFSNAKPAVNWVLRVWYQ
jgi:hypothetical protein